MPPGSEESKLGMENFSGNNVSAHPRGRLWHSSAFRSERYGCQAPSFAVQLSALVPAAGRETLQPPCLGRRGSQRVRSASALGRWGCAGSPANPTKAASGTFLVEPGRGVMAVFRGEKIPEEGWTSFLPNLPPQNDGVGLSCSRREPCPLGTWNSGYPLVCCTQTFFCSPCRFADVSRGEWWGPTGLCESQ